MGRRNRQVESENEGTEGMSRLRLKYVQSFVSAGGVYHYFRRRGSPRIPLPGLPGSAEFMAAYQAALAAAARDWQKLAKQAGQHQRRRRRLLHIAGFP
jgi:hypothetical protein